MKLDFAEDTYQKLVAKGVEHEEAMRQAAGLSNEMFGGINIEQIARNKDFQNFLRSTFLASDWMESNVRLGVGLARNVTPGVRSGLTKGQKMVYTRMTRNLLLSLIVMSVLNKLTSDKWPWENDRGNEFNIDTGLYSSSGQKIYIRPYGTAMDFMRLPFEIAKAAISGDFSKTASTIRNRFSTPLSFALGYFTDRDYAGRPIGWRGIDVYGNQMPLTQRLGGIANEFLGLGLPSFVKTPIDYITGRVSKEEAMTRAAELPVRYSGGAYTTSQKEQRELMKTTGATGEDIYKYFDDKRERNKLEKEAESSLDDKDGIIDKLLGMFEKEPGGDKRMSLIRIKYDMDEIMAEVPEGVVEESKLEDKKLKLAKKIWTNTEEIPDFTDEEKTQLVKELGFTAEDIEYYSVASENNSIKLSYVEDLLSSIEGGEKLSTLAALRYEVGGELILANGVIDDLYDMGYITKVEKKYLKDIKWNSRADEFMNTGAGEDIDKVSLNLPTVKAVTGGKISIPQTTRPTIKTTALTANMPKVPTSLARRTLGGTTYKLPNLAPYSPAKITMPNTLAGLGR
jgi:hypothetical protein